MTVLQRPRQVGFSGLGDDGLDTDFTDSTPDFSASTLPDTSSLASPGNVFATPSASGGVDFSKLAADVVNGAKTYYGAQAAITQAQTAAQLAKAQGSAQLNLTKAAGANAAKTAGAGLPSPTLLLIVGVGLAALVIAKR